MKHVARALVCALALGAAVAAAGAPPAAAAESRAVIVIDTGQGLRRAVITFSGTVTGIKALELAGANPVTYGFAGQGAAVCALDGVGHPATDGCLGSPSDPRYWAYFRAPDGAGSWAYSHECACSTTVRDGDVEGWRFGTGQQPPFSSFCAVAGCAPPPTTPPEPPSGGTPSNNGGASGSVNGATGSSVTPAATVAPAAGDGAPSATSTDPAASSSPTTAATATTLGRTDRGTGDDRESALGLRPRVGDDDGSGSPWGVIAAALVVATLGGLAVVVRRRRSAA